MQAWRPLERSLWGGGRERPKKADRRQRVRQTGGLRREPPREIRIPGGKDRVDREGIITKLGGVAKAYFLRRVSLKVYPGRRRLWLRALPQSGSLYADFREFATMLPGCVSRRVLLDV